jgi:ParB family chromosome partitioning protein
MSNISLGTLLAQKNVPNLGTDREQIEYIDIDQIDDDPNNFYELSNLDELVTNIELIGLQQPIRVRTAAEDSTRCVIVSGHRRRAAIRKLVESGREDLRDVPCIREREASSAALQELRLIYANSDTRKLTSAEIAKQAERVETLLYQLKEEGMEFPGRMRDHLAEVCKIKKTKLANLKVIREKLEPKYWKPAWEQGQVVDSVALTIARMPEQDQLRCWAAAKEKGRLNWYYENEAKRHGETLKTISKLKCPEGGTCRHVDEKFAHTLKSYYDGCASRCCGDCTDLGSCQHACPVFYEQIKRIKADKREARKQEQLAKEEAERPTIQAIQRFWNRFGEARNAADKTVEECYQALDMYYSNSDDQKVIALECLEAKFSTNTHLPYGYSCFLSDVKRYVQIADLLGCSLDYLLCRTDDPNPCAEQQATGQLILAGWMPGGIIPSAPGDAVADFDIGDGKWHRTPCYFDGQQFRFWRDGAAIEMPPIRWMQLPPVEEDEHEN